MTNFIPNSAKGIFCLFWLMGFALLYPSYVGVSFVGWVERSETHQFKLAVIEDQQARYRHADTRWVNRGYQGFALLYPSYDGVSFVGWVERSETHQFKLAVIEDQQARNGHADTRWVSRGYQLSIQFGFNTLIIKAFIC